MIHIRKTPLEVLDDIYNLAYWMTGSEERTTDLVNRTYVNIEHNESEADILKTFRDCYVDTYGQQPSLHITEEDMPDNVSLLASLRQKAADVKLSVLLSEISGMRHAQIAEIVDRPVETIRQWLFWGRKFMAHDGQLKASA